MKILFVFFLVASLSDGMKKIIWFCFTRGSNLLEGCDYIFTMNVSILYRISIRNYFQNNMLGESYGETNDNN